MGLGKSLSTLALLEAVILHKLVTTVLLVVPVNTLENWVKEFDKWIESDVEFHNFGDAQAIARGALTKKWHRRGGLLLISSKTLTSYLGGSGDGSREYIKQTDLLVIDEAHECLKTKGTKCESALKMIRTKRKIALSGTPLQNK